MIRGCWRSVAILPLAWLSAPLHADELRPGFLEIVQLTATDWRLVWKAPLRVGLANQARPIVPPHCKARLERREVSRGALVETSGLHCSGPIDGHIVGLTNLDNSITDTLVRIAPLGRAVQVARLTADTPQISVTPRASRFAILQTYVLLGVGHIISGLDHLLFVIALVLLVVGGRRIVATVTAFTLAHSITLGAATLGFVAVPRKPVEICIALSILFVASEIVKSGSDRDRLAQRAPWIAAFAFGLLHGFGFAGALSEVGLPNGEIPIALLAFNIGVEIGQLAIVALMLVAIYFVQRFGTSLLPKTKMAAAYATGSIAAYWMIVRALA